MPNGTYPGSERPVQENGHVLSTAMNTSVPVSSLHTEPQLQFVNRAYQPEPDVGNRPDSSYTTGPGYFSNNTYDPRQEDGQRSYTPNDQSPVGNASYGADTYRPTSARDYPPDNRLSDASIVYPTNDTRGNTHDASASYQAASNRPSDVSTGQTGSELIDTFTLLLCIASYFSSAVSWKRGKYLIWPDCILVIIIYL